MLIKEYRIPIPLTLEEYQIAQLYMIQKKSREESEGEGSAVEILENRPYTDGPYGSGQYTYKVYHIGRHLPGWFRNIAPKTALEVHEESWNAYPYTKTKFGVPFVDKFSIEVETYFEPDNGCQENKFKLNRSELRQRDVDLIDMVNDQLSGNDYVKEEDPKLYTSQRNGRGPLKSDWITNPPNNVIMCAYKLIKVEFRYWGLQSKVERFIHDYGMRRVMLRAHRQAWAWQDEWVGLTMDDIRRLERETQLILQRKLGRTMSLENGIAEEDEEEEEVKGQQEDNNYSSNNTPDVPHIHTTETVASIVPPDNSSSTPTTPPPPAAAAAANASSFLKRQSFQGQPSIDSNTSTGSRERRLSQRARRNSARGLLPRKFSSTSLRALEVSSPDHSQSTQISRRSQDKQGSIMSRHSSVFTPSSSHDDEIIRPEWAFDQIELSDSDSDMEFFDAKDTITSDEESAEEEELRESVKTNREIPAIIQEVTDGETNSKTAETAQSRSQKWRSSVFSSLDISGDDLEQAYNESSPASPDILFLVLHGGSIYDSLSSGHTTMGSNLDFSTFQQNVDTITELHFGSAIGRVAMRMIAFRDICKDALQLLSQVRLVPTDYNSDPGHSHTSTNPTTTTSDSSSASNSSSEDGLQLLPAGLVPLVATQMHTYQDCLRQVTREANKVYTEFRLSEEGQNFQGQVCIVGDCMGSVVGYDILAMAPSRKSPPPTSPHALFPAPRSPSPQPPSSPRLVSPSSASAGSLFSTYTQGMFQQSRMAAGSASPNLKLSVSQSSTKGMGGLLAGGGSGRVRRKSGEHFNDGSTSPFLQALRDQRRSSRSPTLERKTFNILDGNDDSSLCFEVSHFFAFGSPLGMILASRRARNKDTACTPPEPPSCVSFYNLFYSVDHIASRLEPLLDHRFTAISPMSVPNYKAFPTGSDESYSLKDTVSSHSSLLEKSSVSVPSDQNGEGDYSSKPFSVWWSENRVDYVMETPWGKEAFDMLPVATIIRIINSRYWEAKELVSFILRQVLQHEVVCVAERGSHRPSIQIPFMPQESVVKWNRRTTSMRIHRLKPTHRASDVLVLEGTTPPAIMAKFQYGSLGMASMASLAKEEVEMYVLEHSPTLRWKYVGSDVTDKHGKIMFNMPSDQVFTPGLYPMKFLVKGDHTTTSCNLFVVPPHIEAIVFSIDGALTSNFSISAKDIKLKSGAVEVARSWQELGYLIIYISGRPDVQKDSILSFLGTHDFPLGLVVCADNLSTDSQSLKTAYLGRLIKQSKVIIHAAYGSSRHLQVYRELGLQQDQIYIHGRKTKTRGLSEECQYLYDGFSNHHNELIMDPPRKAMHDAQECFGNACFTIPSIPARGERLKPTVKKSRSFSKRAAFRSQKSASIDCPPNPVDIVVPSQQTVV